MADWNDHIVGDRMTVDQEFSSRVQESRFSSQQWGLIMTATSFEIENPGESNARIVANGDHLPDIMPEVEKIENQMPGPGGPEDSDDSGGSGGFIAEIKDTLGLGGGGGGVDEAKLSAARSLTQEYANELQRHLEERGKWERVQEVAAGEDTEAVGDSDPDDA